MSVELIPRHDAMLDDPLRRREFANDKDDDEPDAEADDPCADDGYGDY